MISINLFINRLLDASELIFDSKKLIALGRLYHTLKWFVREIWELRSSSLPATLSNTEKPKEETLPDQSNLRDSKRWSSEIPKVAKDIPEQDTSYTMLPLRGDIEK
ncbi:hypothetical protein G6F36_015412 [Rhizopus arrhizus]|nr:hypothetical protein G6F36_015412 [Rhizopus arrhizus]